MVDPDGGLHAFWRPEERDSIQPLELEARSRELNSPYAYRSHLHSSFIDGVKSVEFEELEDGGEEIDGVSESEREIETLALLRSAGT